MRINRNIVIPVASGFISLLIGVGIGSTGHTTVVTKTVASPAVTISASPAPAVTVTATPSTNPNVAVCQQFTQQLDTFTAITNPDFTQDMTLLSGLQSDQASSTGQLNTDFGVLNAGIQTALSNGGNTSGLNKSMITTIVADCTHP